MSRVGELEQLLMTYLQTSAPEWTGNLRRHITAFGNSHIRISGPAYNTEVARALVNKHGKGLVRRIDYSEMKDGKRQRIAIKISDGKGGTKQLFDYAWLLNEFGAFGTGRHEHWVNRAVYTACVMYVAPKGGHVDFGGGFQPY